MLIERTPWEWCILFYCWAGWGCFLQLVLLSFFLFIYWWKPVKNVAQLFRKKKLELSNVVIKKGEFVLEEASIDLLQLLFLPHYSFRKGTDRVGWYSIANQSGLLGINKRQVCLDGCLSCLRGGKLGSHKGSLAHFSTVGPKRSTQGSSFSNKQTIHFAK